MRRSPFLLLSMHRCYLEPGAGGTVAICSPARAAPLLFRARRRRHLHARALLVEVALLVGTLPPDLQPAHVGAGTRPTPPTSAPGLGSPRPTSALGQWDWAHTPPTSAQGLGSPRPMSSPGLGSLLAHLRRDCMGSPPPASAADGAGAGRLRLARGLGGLLAGQPGFLLRVDDGEDLHKAAAPRKGAEGTLRSAAVLGTKGAAAVGERRERRVRDRLRKRRKLGGWAELGLPHALD
jgi:hypothetical protein